MSRVIIRCCLQVYLYNHRLASLFPEERAVGTRGAPIQARAPSIPKHKQRLTLRQ